MGFVTLGQKLASAGRATKKGGSRLSRVVRANKQAVRREWLASFRAHEAPLKQKGYSKRAIASMFRNQTHMGNASGRERIKHFMSPKVAWANK